VGGDAARTRRRSSAAADVVIETLEELPACWRVFDAAACLGERRALRVVCGLTYTGKTAPPGTGSFTAAVNVE
jgi:hypothetical protein